MSLSCALRPFRGFHFQLSTNISIDTPRPSCDVYLLHILPADVFVDKYELQEHGVAFSLHGESNLELPVVAADPAGLALDVRVPLSMRVDIPLHARYPLPGASPYSIVRIAEPQAYWACPGSNKSDRDPFAHVSPPYVPSLDLDLLSITFWDTDYSERYHIIEVPAGQPADFVLVEFSTAFLVFAAFFYLAWMVWRTNSRLSRIPALKHE